MVNRKHSTETIAVPAVRRVVLLGASNLTRGISTVVETARLQAGGPIEVLAALGHGRSYGLESSVLGRTLPGICGCGLWEALKKESAAPAVALVTDIGNDLLYGAPVSQIIDWVRRCLDRLQQADAQVVMTSLPVANLDSLSPVAFRLMRTMLFPASRLQPDDARRQAAQLNERLIRMAHERGIVSIEPQRDWYGLDPIHVKFSSSTRAWTQILTSWERPNETRPRVARSMRRWLYLRRLAPEYRRLFGIPKRRAQPSGRFSDGTTVGLY